MLVNIILNSSGAISLRDVTEVLFSLSFSSFLSFFKLKIYLLIRERDIRIPCKMKTISEHSMNKNHQTKALVNIQKELIFIDC